MDKLKLLVYKKDSEDSLDSYLVFIDEGQGETIKMADELMWKEEPEFDVVGVFDVSPINADGSELYTLHPYQG
jgi:hypothetical protein